MEVETYEVEGTDDAALAFDPEALELIEQLGLEGQASLIHKREADEGDEVATICPYVTMSAEEARVYGYLLSVHDNVADYSAGPIPLRVLQVAALCEREDWFTGLAVWHAPTEADIPDPILVGINDNGKYLLARWGDVLLPFEELRDAAIKRWGERRTAKLKAMLAKVEADAQEYFAGSWVESYISHD